jgi:hypothetical protein
MKYLFMIILMLPSLCLAEIVTTNANYDTCTPINFSVSLLNPDKTSHSFVHYFRISKQGTQVYEKQSTIDIAASQAYKLNINYSFEDGGMYDVSSLLYNNNQAIDGQMKSIEIRLCYGWLIDTSFTPSGSMDISEKNITFTNPRYGETKIVTIKNDLTSDIMAEALINSTTISTNEVPFIVRKSSSYDLIVTYNGYDISNSTDNLAIYNKLKTVEIPIIVKFDQNYKGEFFLSSLFGTAFSFKFPMAGTLAVSWILLFGSIIAIILIALKITKRI